MAKYEIRLTGQFDAVVDHLKRDIESSGLSIRLVDESNFSVGDMRVAMCVYDKYFMRNSSRASLSLTVAGKGNDLFVSAIGAGGGNGAIFSFSWGAEEELVAEVERSIKRMIT